MVNLEKYEKVFIDTFGISSNELGELKYHDISEWDSVGHMALMAALEDTFNIMLDTDDIIDFSSFQKGKEILKKYNVEF
jgi:acyl carrier protein